MDSNSIPEGREISFRSNWNINPFTAPQLVNQILMTEGTGTQYGSDGILYMHLGHVSPPISVEANVSGEAELQVNALGYFAITRERAKELRNVLDQIISNSEHPPIGGHGGNIN